MAYTRRRKSYRAPSRRSSYRAPARRGTTRRRTGSATRRSPQTIRIVVEQHPANAVQRPGIGVAEAKPKKAAF